MLHFLCKYMISSVEVKRGMRILILCGSSFNYNRRKAKKEKNIKMKGTRKTHQITLLTAQYFFTPS